MLLSFQCLLAMGPALLTLCYFPHSLFLFLYLTHKGVPGHGSQLNFLQLSHMTCQKVPHIRFH